MNTQTWLKACSLITNAGAKLCAGFTEFSVYEILIIPKHTIEIKIIFA